MLLETALLIALVQGATEFLPISSSGHLILLARLGLTGQSGLALEAAAHLGTLAAGLVYFRREMSALGRGAAALLARRRAPERDLLLLLLLATLPALLAGAGLFASGRIEVLRNLPMIALANILFACLLFLADRTRRPTRSLASMTAAQSFWIGCAQACAFIPGASRAGVVITAARALGFARESAVRFALLLALPVIVGASFVTLLDAARPLPSAPPPAPALLAAVILLSFLAGLLALALFVRFARRWTLTPFVLYRLALAAAILIWTL